MKFTPAQAEAFPWVIERPRALLGAGAGLGKTRVAIDAFRYRRLMGEASVLLVFGPKAVINLSWPDEIAKWAPELTVQNLATDCRWAGADVYLINYERCRHLIKLIQASSEFPPDSIVLDECFVAGTRVDTPQGPRPIEAIRLGDEVINACGVGRVTDTMCHQAGALLAVSFGGARVVCTPNHPFLTETGWQCASELTVGSKLIQSEYAHRLMQTVPRPLDHPLSEILQSEMLPDFSAREHQTLPQVRTLRERGEPPEKPVLQSLMREQGDQAGGSAHCGYQSANCPVQSGETREAPRVCRSHPSPYARELLISRAPTIEGPSGGCHQEPNRRKREARAQAGIVVGGDVSRGAGGTPRVSRTSARGLPYVLQGRPGLSRRKASGGGGRAEPPQPPCQMARPEERSEAQFLRVDGVEALQPGNPGVPPQGKVYNIAVSGHPSYSVGGVIVHNCHSFQNPSAARQVLLKPMLDRVRSVLGLTGTPHTNGYESLYGQCKAIFQDKNPLGSTVTSFRTRHFNQHPRRHYLRTIKAGAKPKIEAELNGYMLCQLSSEWLNMPDIDYQDVMIKLPPKLRRQYETLKADLFARLDNGTVEAVNAAVLVNKLLQFTSGRIFDDDQNVVDIHTLKTRALLKIKERPLLVMREYTHTDIPGAESFSPNRVSAWNRKEIPIFMGHAASMGVGLNLQAGGSALCWHTPSWSHVNTVQSEARLWRTGQKEPVVVYRLLIEDTVDVAVQQALKRKLSDSRGLMLAMKYARQL